MAKMESYTHGIVNTLSNTNSTIESWNHILPLGAANLGFPLTSSMAVGFTAGFLRAWGEIVQMNFHKMFTKLKLERKPNERLFLMKLLAMKTSNDSLEWL